MEEGRRRREGDVDRPDEQSLQRKGRQVPGVDNQRDTGEESLKGGDGPPHRLPRRATQKDAVKRWKDFAPDIQVDWVWMAQNVLRYNVVIVGKFFNKGSWDSEAWRKEHPEGFVDKTDSTQEINLTAQEKRGRLHIVRVPESAVCARLRARHLHTALG